MRLLIFISEEDTQQPEEDGEMDQEDDEEDDEDEDDQNAHKDDWAYQGMGEEANGVTEGRRNLLKHMFFIKKTDNKRKL